MPEVTEAVERWELAASMIDAGSWEQAQEIVQNIRLGDLNPLEGDVKLLLEKAASVLLTARVRREHLRTTLRNVSVSNRFQSVRD